MAGRHLPVLLPGIPPTVDSGTVSIALAPGFAFGSELAVFTDAVTEYFDLQPSGVDVQVPYIDSGTTRLSLTPSASEGKGIQYSDAATPVAVLTPSSVDIFGPFVFTDSNTARLTLTPSVPPPVRRTADDNFDRADGVIGSNWTSPSFYSGTAPVISSNMCYFGGLGSAYWNQDKFGPDCLVSIDIFDYTYDVAIFARMSDDQQNGYMVQNAHSSFLVRLYRCDAGSMTFLADSSATTSIYYYPNAGDTLSLKLRGSEIDVLLNKHDGSGDVVLCSAIDSTYANEGWAAVGMT